MGEVFADRLQVTVDRMAYRDLRSRLLPLLHSVGAAPDFDQPADESGLWREPDGGTFKVTRYGQVAACGASGKFLFMLRAASLLGEFLHILGSEPHKVTVLDATLDVPVDAPPVVTAFYDRATTGDGFQLSRKRVKPTAVTKVFGQREDGRESGTVYLGSRKAEVRLKVYDKQHERFFHGIEASPGLRYELTLKGGLVTLADVYAPSPVFWHHMHYILQRPQGVPVWFPGAVGYTLPRRPLLSPLERLRMRILKSADLSEIVRLCDELPGGRAQLLDEINTAFPGRLVHSTLVP
jgi:hypothetical protein